MHAIFRSIRKREIILQQETFERRCDVREFSRERALIRTVSDEIEPKRHVPVRARKLRTGCLVFRRVGRDDENGRDDGIDIDGENENGRRECKRERELR